MAERFFPLTAIYTLQFEVTLSDAPVTASGRGPRVYKVRLTKVATIDPEYVIALSLAGITMISVTSGPYPVSYKGSNLMTTQS